MTKMTLWWHAYKGGCEHINVTTLLGESSMHPEELAAEGRLTIHLNDCMCFEKCQGDVIYVRSWDHEPSDAERVRAGLDAAGLEDDED